MCSNGIVFIGLPEIQNAVEILKKESFDIIIVDSMMKDVDSICQHICEITCAPIVLLIKGNEANWKNIRSLEVDGFVHEDSGEIELVARLKAISRRKIKNAMLGINTPV